jgi:light-regulated signal transduction histidine kinase (bacteriophytochrome)
VASEIKPEVRIWSETHDDSIHLWVKYIGIGIPLAYQECIFPIFERLHGNQTYPGISIGLAIMSKGIERMGGRMGMESGAGHGSRLWIELPRVKSIPPAQHA